MRTLLPILLLLSTLLPATASAGTGVCTSDAWDAVCVGDYRRASGSCEAEGAERQGTGVSSPLLTVAGERECLRHGNTSSDSQSVIVRVSGAEAKWRHFEGDSDAFGHQDECFLGAGGNVGSLHLGHHFVDCPAGAPPGLDWGHILP